MRLDNAAAGALTGRILAHGQRMAELQRFGGEAMRLLAEWLAEGTVSDMLYRMNEPAALELAHYAGADLVVRWYQRNLRIMANLHRSISGPDDRVLVVYGQGHIPLLRQFTSESPDLCLVNPLPYLIDGR